MCAIFGFLDYGKIMSHKTLTRLLRELSIAAEYRGTDATGISYVKRGKMVTFKKAKPAHKVNLYFPRGTTAVIGHTRFTTQGSEKDNYNNHPFEGNVDGCSFALAHNGVLYNDQKLRLEMNLPDTRIETDSYVAVQLLEQQNCVNAESLKTVAETVRGSFVFTVLRSDNTLFLVKGDNPLTILHFPEYGFYVYASTMDILLRALQIVKVNSNFECVNADDGNIIEISPDGNISTSLFEEYLPYFYNRRCMRCFDYEEPEDEFLDDLLMVCNCFGVTQEDVETLLEYGYTIEEIEEMLLDDDFLHDTLNEIKALNYQ